MYCGDCGAKIEDNEKFCGNCGSSIESNKKRPKKPEKEPIFNCSKCGRKLEYVYQNSQYWCHWCRSYDYSNPSLPKPRGQGFQNRRPVEIRKSKIASYICYIIGIITLIIGIFAIIGENTLEAEGDEDAVGVGIFKIIMLAIAGFFFTIGVLLGRKQYVSAPSRGYNPPSQYYPNR